MIELLWPASLLLLPLPWLVYRWWPTAKSEQAALRAPFFEEWRQLQQELPGRTAGSRKLELIALILIWCCLLLASARPMLYGDPVTLPAQGRDLLLAVDLSGSMQTQDMRVGNATADRLSAVKSVLTEFVQRRRGDRLGLILFGSRAYLQAPLTFDLRTIGRFLQEAQIGFAGNETAIGDAIGLAIKRLRERPGDSRVLILLTDGANTAGTAPPLEAARMAADSGIRIHTIGVGAEEMELPGIFGSSFGSRTTNPSRDLDEATLRQIAQATGGRYFRARNPAELTQIYRLLDQIEPIDLEAETYRPQTSLFHWPLSLAFTVSLLLALRALLARRR